MPTPEPAIPRNEERVIFENWEADGCHTLLRVWECDLAKIANWPRVARRISRRIAKPEFAGR